MIAPLNYLHEGWCGWRCGLCDGAFGNETSSALAHAALAEHLRSPEHDTQYEATLRRNLKHAQEMLYDHLSKKGRVL